METDPLVLSIRYCGSASTSLAVEQRSSQILLQHSEIVLSPSSNKNSVSLLIPCFTKEDHFSNSFEKNLNVKTSSFIGGENGGNRGAEAEGV
jgi:hypothetical protein